MMVSVSQSGPTIRPVGPVTGTAKSVPKALKYLENFDVSQGSMIARLLSISVKVDFDFYPGR